MTIPKIAFIAGFVALLVSGTIWGLAPAKVANNDVTFGNTATNGSQAVLPNPTNYDYLVARLVLGLGTNLSNSNTGANNVNLTAQRATIATATTTPCAIQNPFNATSTLVSATLNITTGTSTTGQLTIATSTTAFSTTSPVYSANVSANAYGPFMVGETASSTGLGIVLSPSTYVVFGVAGAVNQGFTYVGTCSAVFQSV